MPEPSAPAQKRLPLIPVLDGRALDIVKIFAILCMVIDHIDFTWYERLVPPMFLLGRAAFPLFCYATAMAAQKAGPEKLNGHILRLLILALVSEPVSILTRDQGCVNVVFTLAHGVVFISLLPRLKDGQIAVCHALAAGTALLPTTLEFGLTGVMLPSAILLVAQGRTVFIPSLLLLLLSTNTSDFLGSMRDTPFPLLLENHLTIGVITVLLPWMALHLVRNFDAPHTGRYLSKYSLHVFYPLHLVLLWVLKIVFFKG